MTGARPCPICGRPSDPRLRPFCCKRCADVDLHRWLAESYRVPVVEEDDGEDGEEGGDDGDGEGADGGGGR